MSESIRRLTRIGAAALTLCLPQVLPAPATATDLPEYTIRRAGGPIAIDGLLDESSWSAAATAPALPPAPGDIWRLNLYRIGGAVNPQFSVWSDTRTEKAQYHVPERFGVVHFAADTVTAGDDTSGVELER
ncbi:MAG TPA: hypothetical protein EYM39_08880 [Candidatus Latescibacteria bacterium]|nr:hypothetical protein [Candidatus Latescibacterota bacterium]